MLLISTSVTDGVTQTQERSTSLSAVSPAPRSSMKHCCCAGRMLQRFAFPETSKRSYSWVKASSGGLGGVVHHMKTDLIEVGQVVSGVIRVEIRNRGVEVDVHEPEVVRLYRRGARRDLDRIGYITNRLTGAPKGYNNSVVCQVLVEIACDLGQPELP